MPIFKAPNNDTAIYDSAPDGWVEIIDQELDEIRASRLAWVVATTPTLADVVAIYNDAVQDHLDSFAATWRYVSILSAASYANSAVPQFKAEAEALILWRDQTWLSCYNTLAAVEAGTEPMPTSPEALIATLPSAPVRP